MRLRRWLVPIAIVAVAYLAVSYLFSDKLIATRFPAVEHVDFADLGLPDPERVTLSSGDAKLSAWYFKHPDGAGCETVLLHGFAINKAVALLWAPILWGRRCDLFLYDLRSHGESTPGLLTYGVPDKTDELVAVDWLAQKTGLPDATIGLWGVSYGAATSIQAAAARPSLAFVVADASFSSLADIASVQADKQFGAWARVFVPGALFVSGLRADFDPAQASPERAIEGLTTPVLLIHSTTDGFTPSSHSEAIYAASDHSHTELHLTDWGAPHGESYVVDPAAYTKMVDEFIDRFAPGYGAREAANP